MSKRVSRTRALAVCLSLFVAASSVSQAQEKKDQEKSPKKTDESDENLKSLTKLRREQKKRDPITIDVEIPKELHATTRELPVLDVIMKNIDEEKSPVRMWRRPSRGAGLSWRWQFEVRDASGQFICKPHPYSFNGGGLVGLDSLSFGEEWKDKLKMTDYVRIKEPGEYTIRIVYHCEESQFRVRDERFDSLIMCTSKEFKLKVGKPVPKTVEVPTGSRERAKGLISALSDDGPIRLIDGKYDPSLYKFMDPNSPEGQLHKMGRDALPGLLDALRDEKLSFHRRGWVLGMLFFLTEERDLNPLWWEKEGRIIPDYEIRGMGSGSGHGGEPNLAGQREFAKEWLKLAEECWDFRETKK
jgi:hypothetical protein